MTGPLAAARLICDLTQSWSDVGGGVGTYLLPQAPPHPRATPHRHLLIIPGARRQVIEEDRAITVTIASPRVPGSPHYRLMLRNGAVRDALERFRPDLIECQDSLQSAVGGDRPSQALSGDGAGRGLYDGFPDGVCRAAVLQGHGWRPRRRGGTHLLSLLRAAVSPFDAVFALSENGGATKLRSYGVEDVGTVPLGVELGDFGPSRRDEKLRRSLGVAEGQPLLIYVGRLDAEKKPHIVADAFRKLPDSLGARLVLLGEGPLRDEIAALKDPRIHTPGFVRDRQDLARWLASADVYVSAMADETFGVSIVEAQASGLPVVGVAAGAMVDRVTDAIGRLGPVDDSDAMAANILSVWNSDRGRWARSPRPKRVNIAGTAAWMRCSASFTARPSTRARSVWLNLPRSRIRRSPAFRRSNITCRHRRVHSAAGDALLIDALRPGPVIAPNHTGAICRDFIGAASRA